MKLISVGTSQQYSVTIGSGVLSVIGDTVCRLTKAKKVCIVTDSNVCPLYSGQVADNLNKAGLQVSHFTFPAGEKSKNSRTYIKLLNHLVKEGLDRHDCIIALGGGVVGDLAGFAAATYLRGIPYIQVPTTLLAMVDSSVGGKTGIDLAAGKNLCGAFWQPVAVLCDTDTLSTLPEAEFRSGCAEIIKYGILFDPTLFSHLEEAGMGFDRETVISRCVELKANVVAADERESGDRRLLNLGHTIGHAIERASKYTISHGQAIAIGMAVVCRATQCPDTHRIVALLSKLGLPSTTHFASKLLCTHTLADKKRSGDTIHLIVPKAIGDCTVVSTPTLSLKPFIEEGM